MTDICRDFPQLVMCFSSITHRRLFPCASSVVTKSFVSSSVIGVKDINNSKFQNAVIRYLHIYKQLDFDTGIQSRGCGMGKTLNSKQ